MCSQRPAQQRVRHQVSPLPSSTTLPPSLFPTSPGSSIVIYSHSESSLTAACCCTGKNLTNRCRCQVISIDMLPDDVLLEIFCFFVDEFEGGKKGIEAWQPLVHVCGRWRSAVLGSPRRLNLHLVCTPTTPARDTLDVWPALPLIVDSGDLTEEGLDNIIAVLERSDRVRQINLAVPSSHLGKFLAAMQVPFPELIRLSLFSDEETVPVLPDSFCISAPRLRILVLDHIFFPGLPSLLLSTTHLVSLFLDHIPHSWYFSAGEILTALSTLTSLGILRLDFQSRPDWESQRPPPRTRSVLPALTDFHFKGVSEFLDDLVARIDAPQLDNFYITFFNDIVFDTPQFIQFISRTPKLKALENAHVSFSTASVELVSRTSGDSGLGTLKVKISCRDSDWQVSSLEQVCTSCLPPLSTLEDLYISESLDSRPDWQDNIENTQWLELLLPFTALKNLYLSKEFVPRIAPSLQELVGGRTTEVLPILQNISLEGFEPSEHVQEDIGQFVAARQVTSHPIAVSRWNRFGQ